jgi:hypothetical protein
VSRDRDCIEFIFPLQAPATLLLLLDVSAVKEKRNRRKKAEQNLAFLFEDATHPISSKRKKEALLKKECRQKQQ